LYEVVVSNLAISLVASFAAIGLIACVALATDRTSGVYTQGKNS
jgi:hypothetical protein